MWRNKQWLPSTAEFAARIHIQLCLVSRASRGLKGDRMRWRLLAIVTCILLTALSGCTTVEDSPVLADSGPACGAGCEVHADGTCHCGIAVDCPEQGTALGWSNFGQPFMTTYCQSCHSRSVLGGFRLGAP